MKILVDSTLSFKEEWFNLIPLIFTLDGKEIIDKNEKVNRTKILKAKDTSSSFFNFELLKNKEKLDQNEKTIIFTIPKQLSGQYSSYKSANINKNILILEGHCFFIFKDKIKKLLETTHDFEVIKKEISILNNKTEYYGLIVNPQEISKKGRISSVLLKTFSKLHLKIILKFENGKWRKKALLRNVSKAAKKIVENKKALNIIAINKEEFNKYKEIFGKYITKDKIEFKPMSNSMVLHSGKGFISLYFKD